MLKNDLLNRLSKVYVSCVKGAGRALASGRVAEARALMMRANSAASALESRGARVPKLV